MGSDGTFAWTLARRLEPGDEVVFDACGHMVCDCSIGVNGIPPAEFGPNAHLISAAPNLLAALGDLVILASASMSEANRDGAEYDIDAELATKQPSKGDRRR